MKKLIIAALIFSGVTLKAQHDISTDVLGFAFSKFGIGYEYAINSQNSVGIYTSFTSENLLGDDKNLFGDIDYSEFNIMPEYKMFMTPNKGNDGIYAGIYGKYRSSNSKDNLYSGLDPNNALVILSGKTDVSTTGLALGALLGYKWKTSGAFFLEVTAGIGKFLMDDVSYSDSTVEGLTVTDFNEDDYIPYIGNKLPIDLRLAVKVGLRFGGGSSE
jgi:Protein of unknown function (DUF3575)